MEVSSTGDGDNHLSERGNCGHRMSNPMLAAVILERYQEAAANRGRSCSFPENLPASTALSDFQSIFLSNFLDKQNPNGLLSMKGWKRRWFSLDHLFLTYSKSAEDEPIKKISLQNIKTAQSTKEAVFEVATNLFMENGKARTFVLRAETEDLAKTWVAAILSNKAVFKKHMSDPDPAMQQRFRDTYRSLSSPDTHVSLAGGSWSNQHTGGGASFSVGTSGDAMGSSAHDLGGGSGAGGSPAGGYSVGSTRASNGSIGSMGGEQQPNMPRADSFARGLVLLPKKLVSRNKKRFEEDGFSLDLTYITPRLIAMGFPSEGMEGNFRNPVDEVYRFFETRHPDAYMIYNLCPPTERTYAYERFHHRVSSHPFMDHNPPPFEAMRPMCRSIERFLAEDSANVAAIHCKAGKGRTGVMIVAYLLHSGHCATADEAIWLYGNKRTNDGKGVTIPSQRRYCHYFAQNLGQSRPLRRLQLSRIRLVDPPPGCQPVVARICSGGLDVTFNGQGAPADRDAIDLLVSGVVLAGDVSVTLVAKGQERGRRDTWNPFQQQSEELCRFWFHTSFVNGLFLRLEKAELDGATRKDPQTFAVEVHFAGEQVVAGGGGGGGGDEEDEGDEDAQAEDTGILHGRR